MRNYAIWTVLAASLCLNWGCSKSEEKAEAPPAAAPQQVPPHTIVAQFLEAVRVGNDKNAESMLTELARKKTSEMDLTVAPPGSATAKFEVGATELAENGQLAYVESRWTDVGPDGKPEVSEFVWALRNDAAGWRIGGVATQPYPNMPFLQLDFENPEDMIKQTQLAEQEYQRRLNGGNAAGATAQTTGTAAAGTGTATTAATGGTTPTLPGSTVPSAATTGAPGMLPSGAVQNAGGLANGQPTGGVQPVSGFSSGTGGTPAAPVQAQQPQLPGTVNR